MRYSKLHSIDGDLLCYLQARTSTSANTKLNISYVEMERNTGLKRRRIVISLCRLHLAHRIRVGFLLDQQSTQIEVLKRIDERFN